MLKTKYLLGRNPLQKAATSFALVVGILLTLFFVWSFFRDEKDLKLEIQEETIKYERHQDSLPIMTRLSEFSSVMFPLSSNKKKEFLQLLDSVANNHLESREDPDKIFKAINDFEIVAKQLSQYKPQAKGREIRELEVLISMIESDIKRMSSYTPDSPAFRSLAKSIRARRDEMNSNSYFLFDTYIELKKDYGNFIDDLKTKQLSPEIISLMEQEFKEFKNWSINRSRLEKIMKPAREKRDDPKQPIHWILKEYEKSLELLKSIRAQVTEDIEWEEIDNYIQSYNNEIEYITNWSETGMRFKRLMQYARERNNPTKYGYMAYSESKKAYNEAISELYEAQRFADKEDKIKIQKLIEIARREKNRI